ncbi:MAG: RecB family exonuclease, partial [Acidimicrobiia bacterium]
SIPESERGPTETEPGERPQIMPHESGASPPDPLFEQGWDAAYRQTIAEPRWMDSAHPDLADDIETRTEQLVLASAELLGPRPTPAKTPFATSVTNLVALAECSLKFKWIHHDRLPRRPRMSALRGTEFHKRVELHNLGIVPLDEPPESDSDEDAADQSESQPDVDRVDPWESYTKSRFFDEKPFLVETPFEITIDGRSLRGKVDAVYDHGGRWEIVDYKSGRSRESASQLVQLQAYAIAASDGALSSLPHEGINASFAYFGEDPAAEVSTEATAAWLDEARDRIGTLLHTAETGPFPAAPSPACTWCDFLHHCPEGRAAAARMEKKP